MIRIPAIALRGMTILPGMVAHFDISRDKSIKAVEAAMNDNQHIFLVTQRDTEIDSPKIADLFEVGLVAEIKQVIKLQNNIVRVLAEGELRAKLTGFDECEEFLFAEVEELEDVQEEYPPTALSAMNKSIRDNFSRFAKLHGKISPDAVKHAHSFQDLTKLINMFQIHFR
jgi:ATP-dependent Lon protease